jgi:hypothetical protein
MGLARSRLSIVFIYLAIKARTLIWAGAPAALKPGSIVVREVGISRATVNAG